MDKRCFEEIELIELKNELEQRCKEFNTILFLERSYYRHLMNKKDIFISFSLSVLSLFIVYLSFKDDMIVLSLSIFFSIVFLAKAIYHLVYSIFI